MYRSVFVVVVVVVLGLTSHKGLEHFYERKVTYKMMLINYCFHEKDLSELSFVKLTFSFLQFVQQAIVLRSVLGQLSCLPSLA